MSEPPSLDVALANLQRTAEVGFARLDGQMQLVIQRADHADRRVDELTARQERDQQSLAARVDALEDRAHQAVTQDQLTARSNRIIAVVGLMVTAAGVVITLVLGVLN